MLLYTIGDSFTYGEELAEPSVSAWPVLLARQLEYDLVNQGSPGASNDYMVRNIVADIPVLNPDLVIVAWTACHRQEFADRWDMYNIWPGCSGLGVETCYDPKLGTAIHRRELIKYITMHNSPEYQYSKWLQLVILTQAYLKSFNIPYIFVNTFNYNIDEYYKFNTVNEHLISQIDTGNYVGWPDKSFLDWCYGFSNGPGGHPLEPGHQSIAENLHKEVVTRSLKK